MVDMLCFKFLLAKNLKLGNVWPREKFVPNRSVGRLLLSKTVKSKHISMYLISCEQRGV